MIQAWALNFESTFRLVHVELHQFLGNPRAEQRGHIRLEVGGRLRSNVASAALRLLQTERHAGVVNGILGHHFGDPVEFVWGRFEDAQSRGHVVEQVLDGDLRSWVGGARFGLVERFAVWVFRLEAAGRTARSGQNGQLGHVTDGGQSFASEAESLDGRQVAEFFELGRCKSLADDVQVLFSNARTVVRDLQQLQAAPGHQDVDGRSSGVERVLQQLF